MRAENPYGLSSSVVIFATSENFQNGVNAQGIRSSLLMLMLVGQRKGVVSQRRFLSLSQRGELHEQPEN